jgi:hypothetical protein
MVNTSPAHTGADDIAMIAMLATSLIGTIALISPFGTREIQIDARTIN